jgi:TRAP-type uncharacterized transport system fused permease subunit
MGAALLSVAVEGFLFVNLPFLIRLLFFASALSLIAPGINSDLIGFGLAAIAIAGTLYIRKKYGRQTEEKTVQ